MIMADMQWFTEKHVVFGIFFFILSAVAGQIVMSLDTGAVREVPDITATMPFVVSDAKISAESPVLATVPKGWTFRAVTEVASGGADCVHLWFSDPDGNIFVVTGSLDRLSHEFHVEKSANRLPVAK